MNDRSDYIKQAAEFLKTEIDEIQRPSEKVDLRFARASEALHQRLDQQGKVTGAGKPQKYPPRLPSTFNSPGAPAVGLDCQNALHGDLVIVAFTICPMNLTPLPASLKCSPPRPCTRLNNIS
jgi:D-arabinose 5-phosphate isomerase GutQ